MNARRRVSVITPTLNQGRFIEHTIRSLLAQTMTDFEHIVVDGGSADETHFILRRYESQYDLRWVSGKDAGMYDAINRGLAMADGEIHAYLNSDDLYFPWALEMVTSYLASRPDVDVVTGDTINIDDTTGDEYFRLFPAADLGRLVTVMPLPQPAVFWRREVTLGLSGFKADLQYVGDWDFFMRAGDRYRIEKIDEFLAIERRHDASKSLGQARLMAIENANVQGARRGPGTRRLDAALLNARALAARRATWIRFLREARRRDHRQGGPWSRILDSGDVAIDVPRLLAGFIPGVPYRWKVGAIRTGRDWLRPE